MKRPPHHVLMVILLISIIAWEADAILPKATTPQTPKIRRQNMLEVRGMNGDVAALRELFVGDYYESESSKMDVALHGAAMGNVEFQRIYFEYYTKKMTVAQQRHALTWYTKELRGPVAGCFLQKLQDQALGEGC